MSDGEIVGCPTCWQSIHHVDLCEHDDPETGPLCKTTCCPFWHGEESAA